MKRLFVVVSLVLCIFLLSVSQATSASEALPREFRLKDYPRELGKVYSSTSRLNETERIMLAGGILLTAFDPSLHSRIRQLGRDGSIWSGFNLLGEPLLHGLIGVALGLTGNELGEDLLLSVAYNGINTQLIKVATGMSRPYVNPQPITEGPSLRWDFNAFPSGHTSSSFAVASVLSHYYPKYRWLWHTAALGVGLARIHSDKHWPSNVVFGIGVGLFSARQVLNRERE